MILLDCLKNQFGRLKGRRVLFFFFHGVVQTMDFTGRWKDLVLGHRPTTRHLGSSVQAAESSNALRYEQQRFPVKGQVKKTSSQQKAAKTEDDGWQYWAMAS